MPCLQLERLVPEETESGPEGHLESDRFLSFVDCDLLLDSEVFRFQKYGGLTGQEYFTIRAGLS
jgi:hypothetical protein